MCTRENHKVQCQEEGLDAEAEYYIIYLQELPDAMLFGTCIPAASIE